jgi:hypothetical protein
LPCIINQLVETGKSRQLHLSRHVASNILSCLGIVAVVALPGALNQNYSLGAISGIVKQLEREHLFRNVPRPLN